MWLIIVKSRSLGIWIAISTGPWFKPLFAFLGCQDSFLSTHIAPCKFRVFWQCVRNTPLKNDITHNCDVSCLKAPSSIQWYWDSKDACICRSILNSCVAAHMCVVMCTTEPICHGCFNVVNAVNIHFSMTYGICGTDFATGSCITMRNTWTMYTLGKVHHSCVDDMNGTCSTPQALLFSFNLSDVTRNNSANKPTRTIRNLYH